MKNGYFFNINVNNSDIIRKSTMKMNKDVAVITKVMLRTIYKKMNFNRIKKKIQNLKIIINLYTSENTTSSDTKIYKDLIVTIKKNF